MKAKNKAINNELLNIALKLPFNYTEVKASIPVHGWQILESNPEAVDGSKNPIDAKKKYFINGTQRHPVNHYKRMKRILKEHGEDGVKKYIMEVIDLELHAMKPVAIGGIQTTYE